MRSLCSEYQSSFILLELITIAEFCTQTHFERETKGISVMVLPLRCYMNLFFFCFHFPIFCLFSSKVEVFVCLFVFRGGAPRVITW